MFALEVHTFEGIFLSLVMVISSPFFSQELHQFFSVSLFILLLNSMTRMVFVKEMKEDTA